MREPLTIIVHEIVFEEAAELAPLRLACNWRIRSENKDGDSAKQEILAETMKKISRFFIIVSLVSISGCRQQRAPFFFKQAEISHVLTQMTELMIHDVTNPPLAARFFSYFYRSGY